jgi:hypothetical protein
VGDSDAFGGDIFFMYAKYVGFMYYCLWCIIVCLVGCIVWLCCLVVWLCEVCRGEENKSVPL